MDRELQINKLVIHSWASQANDGGTFNCDYWDCPNQILPGDTYYIELYPEGQTQSYCLKCSAYFMGQALNMLVSNWE